MATLLSNLHLPNFLKGTIFQGSTKQVCVPGLNCYSCPGAAGACPIGAMQAVVGSSKFKFSYYITGMLIFIGVLLGRFVCGFLCPFGWFQDLLHKIPTKKFSTKKLSGLSLSEISHFGCYGFSSACACGKRSRHGKPLLLQISLSAGGVGGCHSALPRQHEHPLRPRLAVCMEKLCACGCNHPKHTVLSPLLQMDLPLGCVLRMV